jgi:type II secretory pathway pseudopilin PulG
MLGQVANAAKPASEQQQTKTAEAPKDPDPEVTILNPSTKAKTEPAKTEPPKSEPSKPNATKGAQIQTASVAGSATQLKTPAASKSGKCKVWTASYGGQRAIIIKAVTDGTTNYTVLDVNDPNESREVDAYIAAYAKGGEKVATFPNQAKALDKAFELCPEG